MYVGLYVAYDRHVLDWTWEFPRYLPRLARKREIYGHVVTITLGFSSDEVASIAVETQFLFLSL